MTGDTEGLALKELLASLKGLLRRGERIPPAFGLFDLVGWYSWFEDSVISSQAHRMKEIHRCHSQGAHEKPAQRDSYLSLLEGHC